MIDLSGPAYKALLKSDLCLPLALFFVTFLTYSFTLSPHINFGDSPELISSAYTLGISHPPGYPLYSIVGKLFSFLPGGESVARKVNLLSAFSAAGSIFFIASIIGFTGKDGLKPGLVIASLALAASPTLWSQSVIAEVYTLNLFFFSLLLYLAFLWQQRGDNRYLLLAAFLYGIGLGNHHTLVAFGPLLLIFLFLHKSSERGISWKVYTLLPLFFILGITVYAYLPLRSLQNPAMDWGDPETIKRFLDVVLRRQFPTTEAGITVQKGFLHLIYHLKRMSNELTPLFFAAGLWGMVRSCRSNFRIFILLLSLFLVHGVGTYLFLNPSSADSYESVDMMVVPSYAIFTIWIGYGIKDLASILSKIRGGRIIVPVFVILLTINLAWSVSASYSANTQRNNYFVIEYAENVFKSIEQDGVIFIESDNTLFPLWYLQYVEGKRRDVAAIDVDFLMLPWFKRQIMEKYPGIDIKVEDLGKHASNKRKVVGMDAMLDAFKVGQLEVIAADLIGSRPLYISYEFGPVYNNHKSIKGVYVLDHGLIYKISRKYERPDFKAWDSFNLRTVLDGSINTSRYARALSIAYINILQRRANILFNKGKKGEANRIMERIKEIKVTAAAIH